MNKAIRMENYGVRYGEDAPFIVKNCSFFVDYGELVLLAGLSGCGKSTLLSSINGILPNAVFALQEGEIFVDGESILGKRITEISVKVGSVLQNANSQIVHARVEDEIAFGCENRNISPEETKKKVLDACAMLELDPNWGTKTLSGGQKQRLITASTLAMGQKILVFDEPLANLDTEGALLLLRLLKRLTKEEGYAVLFVEHRLDVVLPFADRVYWMEDGAVAELSKDEQKEMKGRGRLEDSGEVPKQEALCLKAEHLAFSAAKRDILKDISFELKQGERLVILGENGCGKTALLRLLARLLPPSGGAITQFVDPTLNNEPSKRWFQTAGYVYQDPNYQLFMPTVEAEVQYQSPGEAQTKQTMEDFALSSLAPRHPQSLSEGQKRRVSIAAIAAAGPKILFLDEPTVGQDFENLQRMVEMLNALHKSSGMTMITVTHDVRCAAALADKVLWIKDGCVYREGGKELIAAYEAAHTIG